MWDQTRLTPVGAWTADQYRQLHDQLEAEIADLRAVVDLEVTAALTGVVPPQYVTPYARRTALAPLPADHSLARREPWWPDDLIPSIDEVCRRPGEGWFGR
jgi:hypothetical protein